MKFWRRRIDSFQVPPPVPMPYPMDAHPPADFDDTQPWRLRYLDRRVAELEQLVAELSKASHDHCIGCGAMTPEYGITECGRVACSLKAMA